MTAPGVADTLDAERIDVATLEPGQFPVTDSPDFRIHLAAASHERIWAHARETPRVEVCGVLVGRARRDAQGPYLEILEVIRGEHAASEGAQVTFTHRTWSHINAEMDGRFPQLKIVGWYHTHPGFGIFLSQFDTFIHQSTFANPTQVAFVVDPIAAEEGFFVWKQGKPAPARAYWVGNRLHVFDPKTLEQGVRPEGPVDAGGGGGGAVDPAPAPGASTLASREPAGPAHAPVADLLLLLLALACGGFIGLWLGEGAGRREVKDLLVQEMHNLVKLGVLRAGLDQELAVVTEALRRTGAGLDPTPDGKGPTPEQLKEAQANLLKVQDRLARLAALYAGFEGEATRRLQQEGASITALEGDVDRTRAELREARRIIALTLVEHAKAALAKGGPDAKEEAQVWLERALGTYPEGKAELEKRMPGVPKADGK